VKRAHLGLCLVVATGVATLTVRSPVRSPVPRLVVAEAKAEGKKAPTLDELFAQFSRSPGVYARFDEERQIALLAVPMKSSGTVHFDRKQGLVRHTQKPKRQSVRLLGDTLTVWDGTKVQTVHLENPTLRAFSEAFVRLLSADKAGLERDFTIQFTSSADQTWTVTLTPKNEALKKVLRSLEMTGRGSAQGQGAEVSKLVIREASGDSSTMTFSEIDVAHTYASDDAAFAVPPKP
jgi:Outer membrane lipoprotein carrier protein LolA-like